MRSIPCDRSALSCALIYAAEHDHPELGGSAERATRCRDAHDQIARLDVADLERLLDLARAAEAAAPTPEAREWAHHVVATLGAVGRAALTQEGADAGSVDHATRDAFAAAVLARRTP